MRNRFLISLGTLGVAGGSGAGLYYGVNKLSEKQEGNPETILWTLTFKEENDDTESTTSKIYKTELKKSQETSEKSGNSEECKLENEKNLICTVSNVNDEVEAKKYLVNLSSSLKATSTEEKLIDKLKEKLSTIKQEFEKYFGESLYKKIEEALKLGS